MATGLPQQLGVTPPLSVAFPTEAENQATSALIEELRRQNNYESSADTQKRTAVLVSLQSIVEAFVKKVSKVQNLSDAVANAAGGKVFTFGSFRLGVFGPGSDIDTLVVAPGHVTRENFFEYFPDLLIQMAPEGAITDLTPVRESFVPIIKFEYSGISIDLIFSHLPHHNQVPMSLSLDDTDTILRGLQEEDMRCLNGTRVTDAILQLVPQPAIFRTALRGIKLWAQRRAIYANIMGFFGGVAWAMLVARVCQLYPKATSSTMILKFFRIIEKWPWPQPVTLRSIEYRNGGFRVWNPKAYKGDSFHLMPIITPAYPSMCATHNITRSTMEIISRELKRGGSITDQIMLGKAQWKDLFAKHTFFTLGYKYYLSVISASTTRDAQHLWAGLVESKVRLLVVSLEGHDSINLAHPFNKGFERVHSCKADEEIEKAKSGSLQFQVEEIPTTVTDPGTIKVSSSNADGESSTTNGDSTNGPALSAKDAECTIVYTTTHYIGLEFGEGGAKSLDLSWYIEDWKKKCTSWDKHDEHLNALNVMHTRNFDLPDDVFSAGEVKPTQSKKKKRRKIDDTSESEPLQKRQQTSVAAAG